jgi:hypothetical protein
MSSTSIPLETVLCYTILIWCRKVIPGTGKNNSYYNVLELFSLATIIRSRLATDGTKIGCKYMAILPTVILNLHSLC